MLLLLLLILLRLLLLWLQREAECVALCSGVCRVAAVKQVNALRHCLQHLLWGGLQDTGTNVT
jgi:hypothetical protein